MGGQESKNKTPATSSCILGSDPQSHDSTVDGEVHRLSLDSLKQVTECLLDKNKDVAKVILDCRKDIRNDKEFFELVNEYFNNCSMTMDFYNALEKCLQRARDNHALLRVALNKFDKETETAKNNQFPETLQALMDFKAAGNPFTEEFFKIYQSVWSHKELESMPKKVVVSTLVVNKFFLYICSIVALAISGITAIGATIATAFRTVVEIAGISVCPVLEKLENPRNGTYVVIKDMEDIRILIDPLESKIESLMQNVDIASEHDDVKVAIEEIKTKLDGFMNNVEDLKSQAGTFRNNIMSSKKTVLSKIEMFHHS